MVEKIFAGLQRLAEMPVAEKRERQAVANHVVVAQDSGDSPARGAVRNVHEDLLRPVAAIGAADLRIKPAALRRRCAAIRRSARNPSRRMRLILLRGGALRPAARLFKIVAQENCGGHVVDAARVSGARTVSFPPRSALLPS